MPLSGPMAMAGGWVLGLTGHETIGREREGEREREREREREGEGEGEEEGERFFQKGGGNWYAMTKSRKADEQEENGRPSPL